MLPLSTMATNACSRLRSLKMVIRRKHNRYSGYTATAYRFPAGRCTHRITQPQPKRRVIMSTQANVNKVAIVTGASRGIGAAIAKRLASEGIAVVVNYAGRAADANVVVEEIQAAGGRAA